MDKQRSRKPIYPHHLTPKNKNLKIGGAVRKTATAICCTPLRIQADKRSLSLQDLSPGFQENIVLRRSFICQEKLPRERNLPMLTGPSDSQTRLLTYLVYCRFLKMVWKRKKVISEEQETHINSCNVQAKRLKAQVETLKSLLASDEQIISSSFREVQSLKVGFTTLQTKYILAKEENDEMETRAQRLREDLLRTEAEASNNKNSLIIARTDLADLEGQLNKAQEECSKVKREKKALTARVGQLTSILKGKCNDIEKLEEVLAKLQEQMTSQMQVIKEFHVKVEESDRAREVGERQLEVVKTRLKEEKLAYEDLLQRQILKTSSLEAELKLYQNPSKQLWMARFTNWLLCSVAYLATW